jgi:hypothetical protein
MLGMRDAFRLLPGGERYTYIFQGISQPLDYVLYSIQSIVLPVSVDSAHINADYPVEFGGIATSIHRSSDHDPVLVRFAPAQQVIFLPLVLNK